MRTVGGGQSAQPGNVTPRVWIADSSDVLVDRTTSGVVVEYEDPSADAPIGAATITFRRGEGVESLAPLMTVNPPIDLNRRVMVEVPVGGGTYKEIFRGAIDAVRWPERYGDLVIECRDQARNFADTRIETIRAYGSAAGVALETVAQAVADDNLAVSPTIYVPTATGAVVVTAEGAEPYKPSESVYEAQKHLADSIGWAARYRYIDSLSDWRFTLFEPSRTKTVADHTFADTDYFDVSMMEQDIEDIRNVIVVEYSDADGVRQTVQVQDAISTGGAMTAASATLTITGGDTFAAGDVGKVVHVPGAGASGAKLKTTIATFVSSTEVTLATAASTTVSGQTVEWGSIAKYGRRYAKISEASDSPIDTAAKATQLANAALSDLKEPDAILEVRCPYFWPGEVGVDLYTFTANDVHFSADQTLAPVSIRHRIAVGERSESRIICRGNPTGGVLTWRKRAMPPKGGPLFEDKPETKLLQNFRARDSADGLSEVITWTNGAKLEEVWIATRTVEGNVTDADWTALAQAVESKGLISTYTVTKPTETDGTARVTLVQIEGTYTDPATGNLVNADAWTRVIRPKWAADAIDPDTGELADGAVQRAAQVSDGVLTASHMLESLRRFASDVVFSASDNDTVAWGAGTIALADGTNYAITAGNTGNMLAPTFIYLDAAVSTTVLQTTTTLATAVGDRKLLVCYARPIADATQFAMYVPAVGLLGMNEENLQANSVNANHITSISLSVLQAVVNQLSALTADLGTVTAGTIAASVSITVGASTTYESGYDPSTKETPAGAQSKADAAESDAKLYADGLVTPLGAIILATTAPTTRSGGSALVAGDMWLDTDDGNKPYTWTGSAWGAAYTRIDGGSIVTGTIQAGIVFAGELSAATGTFAGALSAATIDTQGTLQIDLGARTYFETPGLKWVSGANAARIASGDAIDIDLIPASGGHVDFHMATTSGLTATGNYLPIKVNGTVRYLALYS